MTKTSKWAFALGIGVILIAAGVYRGLASRQAATLALQAQQAAQKQLATVELADSDIARLQMLQLEQLLPVSGPIKAVNTAVVKARVSGELQQLAVREGDTVLAGQVIARVDATDYQSRLRQAQLQADAAKAQVDMAQRALANNRALVDKGFISTTALESSLSTLAANQATYQAAQAGADIARKAVEDAVLRAPISGLVAQRLAQPGERVSVDARVVEIVDLRQLELEASVSAADSTHVKPGQTASLVVEGTDSVVAAKVVRINPSATSGSRSVLVYLALVPNPQLRQGLFASGSVATGSREALAVPQDCIRHDKPKPYIQIVQNGAVVHHSVEPGILGSAQGQAMVELRNLPPGTEVLRGAVGLLREGTQVRRGTGAS